MLKKGKNGVFRIAWKASGKRDGANGAKPLINIWIEENNISKKKRKKYMKAYKKAALLRLLNGNSDNDQN